MITGSSSSMLSVGKVFSDKSACPESKTAVLSYFQFLHGFSTVAKASEVKFY